MRARAIAVGFVVVLLLGAAWALLGARRDDRARNVKAPSREVAATPIPPPPNAPAPVVEAPPQKSVDEPPPPIDRPTFADVEALLPRIESAKDSLTHDLLMHELVTTAARLDYRDQMKAREKMLEVEQRRSGIVPQPIVVKPPVVLNPEAPTVPPSSADVPSTTP